LEARTFAGDWPEYRQSLPELDGEDKTGQPLQKQQQQIQTMTADHRSNNTIIKRLDFLFFFSRGQLLLRRPP
jgi:hypothetical protein